MILNFNKLIDHNKKFYDTFIDLKVVGWNTYSKALNTYTMHFYQEQLLSMDKAVAKLALIMKGDFSE